MANDMIWVRNEDYNRVKKEEQEAARKKREADRKLREEQEHLRRAKQEADRVASRDARIMRERIEAETNRLLEGIDSVSEEMRNSLRRHVEETHRQMDVVRSSVYDVQRQADRIEGKVDELAETVNASIRSIAEAAAEEQSRAQFYANQFNELLRQINSLHPDKLTPGVVEQEFAPVTNFLAADMANTDYQAAIGLAQSKIPESVALRTRLEYLNAQFRDLQAEGKRLTDQLRETVRQLRDSAGNHRIVEARQNSYEYDGNIAFWTNDLFDVAVRNFEDTCRRFTMAEREMDLEGMGIAIHQLNQVVIQLEECEDLAIHEFQISGMVQDLATSICESLTADETWTLSQSGFAEDDARRAFQMAYEDGDGNTASVVVIPNREVTARREAGEIQFFVDVCDGEKTENREQCEIIRNGLLSRLASDRIELGVHNQRPGHQISADQASFVQEATRRGDRIKEDRLAIVREQLQLTTETGV